MIGVAAVRAAMLASLGMTGLGMAALALAGEATPPLPARSASQAPGTVLEASRAPGTLQGAGRAPGTVRQADRAPRTARDEGQVPETATDEEADGGRDPFARPVASGSRPSVETRPSGLSDLAVDEVVLRGVVTTRDGRLAVLEGPDGRAWVARPGERLHDGTLHRITADEVLFLRDAADPVAEPVVGKRLRDGESAR